MLSKEDYLKKYLSNNEKKKGKKTKRPKAPEKSRMKIIDEDAVVPIEYTEDRKVHDEEEIVELEPEENPVVVLAAGTRADELKMIGKFQTSNWRNLEDDQKSDKKSQHKTRKRHDSDSDDNNNSNRIRGDNNKSANSNIVRKRHDSDSDDDQCSSKDLSPPRQRRRSINKSDSDSDSNVKRKRKDIKVEPDSDASPPRRRDRSADADLSPPRKTIKTEPDSDSSPPRRNDAKTKLDSDSSKTAGRRRSTSRSVSPPPTHSVKNKIKLTLSGTKSGLQNAKDLRNEMKILKKKQEEIFEKYGETTGKNAQTKVRRKMVAESKRKKEPTEEEKRRKAELEEKYKVWNKGVKQVKERADKLQEMADIVDKPLARYAGDEDLEIYLKDQMMADDPMKNYVMDKRVKEGKHIPSVHVYRGPPAPLNRYGILPGYRWDGVDRSNGFEKKLLSQGNLKKAEEEEYYQWSSGRFE